jgi:hypothetical protein
MWLYIIKQMFTIKYTAIASIDDEPKLEFIYEGEVGLSLSITGSSIFNAEVNDWQQLVEKDQFCMEFGDSYGSHVDNGIVSIEHEGSQLKFCVDGAKGGILIIKIPLSTSVKEGFYQLSRTIESEYNAYKSIMESDSN